MIATFSRPSSLCGFFLFNFFYMITPHQLVERQTSFSERIPSIPTFPRKQVAWRKRSKTWVNIIHCWARHQPLTIALRLALYYICISITLYRLIWIKVFWGRSIFGLRFLGMINIQFNFWKIHLTSHHSDKKKIQIEGHQFPFILIYYNFFRFFFFEMFKFLMTIPATDQ